MQTNGKNENRANEENEYIDKIAARLLNTVTPILHMDVNPWMLLEEPSRFILINLNLEEVKSKKTKVAKQLLPSLENENKYLELIHTQMKDFKEFAWKSYLPSVIGINLATQELNDDVATLFKGQLSMDITGFSRDLREISNITVFNYICDKLNVPEQHRKLLLEARLSRLDDGRKKN